MHPQNSKVSIKPPKSPFALGFLEHLSDGVLVLDQRQRIVAINNAITSMLGWRIEDLVGRLCMQLLFCPCMEGDHSVFEGVCPYMSDGATTLYRETQVRTKDGGTREMSVSFSPLWIGGEIGENVHLTETDAAAKEPQVHYSLIILRDITEQKRLERVKNQFLVTASHQLRTPLAAIKASVGLLLDNAPKQLEGPLTRLLQNIQSSSTRLERLVNDLIELANLQTGRVQLQQNTLDVSRLVQRSVELVLDRMLSKTQPLDINLPSERLYIRGDSTRLAQVLSHLLSNASKFSADGSPISLKVEYNKQENSAPEVVFSIIDHGRGISSEEQPLIFEKFYQSPVIENSDGSGSGLGLPLARALVELHGGRLWFESVEGKGSKFYFSLPLVSQEG